MVAVPSFVSANAKRGLDLLEFAGDGLRDRTVNEAREMARGSVTPDKVMRMAAWFARHIVDLDSPRADAYLEGKSERPTPGQVAWLLWGGSLGKDRLQAKEWADRKRDQLIESGDLDKVADDLDDSTATLRAMPLADAPSSLALANVLREVLANVVVFYFSAHRAHWNVTGPDFLEYHDLFANIYEDAYGSIDPLAENIRKIGSFPETLAVMLLSAGIKDDSQTSAANELAADLMSKNSLIIRLLKASFRVANAADEQGIANFIAERIDSHEKWAWQLSASLSS